MERYKLNPLDYRPLAPDGASGQGPAPPNPRPGGGPSQGGFPGGGPSPGSGNPPPGRGLPPPRGDNKGTQADVMGDDKNVQTEEQPGAAEDDFQDAQEGVLQRPAFLPGEETIMPALVGPRSAAVPVPATHIPNIDIYETPSTSEAESVQDDSHRRAVAQMEATARAAAAQNRMETRLNAPAPSQLAAQTTIVPAAHNIFSSESEAVDGEEADEEEEPGEEREPGSEEEKIEETQLAVSNKLQMIYEGASKIIHDQLMPSCLQCIRQDQPLTVKIGLATIKLTVVIAKAVLNDPNVILGCLLGAMANDFEFRATGMLHDSLRVGSNSFFKIVSLGVYPGMPAAPYDMWAHAIQLASGGLAGAKLGLKGAVVINSFKMFIKNLTSGMQQVLDAPEPSKLKRLGRVAREISDYKRGESDPPTDAEMDQALEDVGYTKTQRPKTRHSRLQALRDTQDRFALMHKPAGSSSERQTLMPYPFVRDVNRRSSRAAASSSSSAAPISADAVLDAMLRNPENADAIHALYAQTMEQQQESAQESEQERPRFAHRRHRTKRPKTETPERGSGLPNIPEHAVARIHVPDPVLPHNDVSNDPYLIKSHHNSIVE